MKIGIYIGGIPSKSRFIDHLIDGLSKNNKVILFGRLLNKVNNKYTKTIICGSSRGNKIALLQLLFRCYIFFLKPIKFIKIALLILKTEKVFIGRLDRFIRIIPILIYEPSILHVQWANSIKLLYPYLEVLDSKVVLSLRGKQVKYGFNDNMKIEDFYQKYLSKIHFFHAVSNDLKNQIIKFGVPNEKVKVIYTSVDDQIINPRQSYKFNKNIEVVSIGSPYWRKGYCYSLDAINSLILEGYKIKYTIFYGKEAGQDLRAHIDDLNLNDHVNVVEDYITSHNLFNLIKGKDIFLLSSTFEGVANAVIEAMALGIVVISTDAGGMKEIIQDKKNGYIIQSRSKKAIISAIKNIILEDERNILRIVKSARKSVEKNHLLSNYRKQFMMLYNDLD